MRAVGVVLFVVIGGLCTFIGAFSLLASTLGGFTVGVGFLIVGLGALGFAIRLSRAGG